MFKAFSKAFALLSTTLFLFSTAKASDPDSQIVALVAPSTQVNEKVVECFRTFLSSQGLETYLAEGYQDISAAPYGYYANADEVRASNLQHAFENYSVIWSLRGGYGAQSVIRQLTPNLLEIDSTSKLFIGFSDATLIGLWWHIQGGRYLHGPMYYGSETAEVSGASIGKQTSLQEVIDIIKGNVTEKNYFLTPLNDLANTAEITSSLLGGNLSLIQRNLFGLLNDLDFIGKVLFLEDTTEDVKRAGDILHGMFDSGRFDEITAVVFGDWELKGGAPQEFMQLFDKFLVSRGLNIPLYQNTCFGHGTSNTPLPMGTEARIRPTDNGIELIVSTQW
jgi:muramoyltetrapeptide carboxypeptidase LdcA involved in peptidoglycan recycling